MSLLSYGEWPCIIKPKPYTKKEIQKANISSWERYCQELEGASGSVRFHRVLANRMKLC